MSNSDDIQRLESELQQEKAELREDVSHLREKMQETREELRPARLVQKRVFVLLGLAFALGFFLGYRRGPVEED
jgi:type VI protein secretion system component VasF